MGPRVTIALGAAMVKGKITLAENAKVPAQLHVHLIPAEADAIVDVLRFGATSAEADGAFTFKNLAPGKYFVLAQTIPDSESGSTSVSFRAWNPVERKRLRKEAEATNRAIELNPICKSLVTLCD